MPLSHSKRGKSQADSSGLALLTIQRATVSEIEAEDKRIESYVEKKL